MCVSNKTLIPLSTELLAVISYEQQAHISESAELSKCFILSSNSEVACGGNLLPLYQTSNPHALIWQKGPLAKGGGHEHLAAISQLPDPL